MIMELPKPVPASSYACALKGGARHDGHKRVMAALLPALPSRRSDPGSLALLIGRKAPKLFPELPSIGSLSGCDYQPMAGLFAPAGIPRPPARLHAEVNNFLAEAGTAEKFNGIGGVEPYITSSKDLAALLQAQYALYARIVKDIGATLD
jgi:hypothetical protein